MFEEVPERRVSAALEWVGVDSGADALGLFLVLCLSPCSPVLTVQPWLVAKEPSWGQDLLCVQSLCSLGFSSCHSGLVWVLFCFPAQ